MRQNQRDQHIANNQRGTNTGLITDNHHHRRNHLANEHPVGQKPRQVVFRQHTCNPANPGMQLVHAMQQQHQTQRQA